MQARPEHHGLAGHHKPPAEDDQANTDIPIGVAEEEQHVSNAMGDDRGGREEETPDVAPAAALEGDEAQNDQLDGIVPGDGREGGKQVGLDLVARGMFASQRIGDVQGAGGRHGRRDIARRKIRGLKKQGKGEFLLHIFQPFFFCSTWGARPPIAQGSCGLERGRSDTIVPFCGQSVGARTSSRAEGRLIFSFDRCSGGMRTMDVAWSMVGDARAIGRGRRRDDGIVGSATLLKVVGGCRACHGSPIIVAGGGGSPDDPPGDQLRWVMNPRRMASWSPLFFSRVHPENHAP